MTGPSHIRNTFNGITDAVRFARGEISQNEWAELCGVSKGSFSAKSKEHLKNALEQLSNRYEQLANDAEQLRTLAEQLKNDAEQEVNDVKHFRTLAEQYRTASEQLKRENEHLRTLTAENEQRLNDLQAFKDRHDGRDAFLKMFGDYRAENAMLVLLALFDVVGSFVLLWEDKPAFAVCAALPLGFALIHFTAKGEVRAKVFASVFALAIGGFAFDVFPAEYSKYMFAFTPGILAIIIAFGERLRNIQK